MIPAPLHVRAPDGQFHYSVSYQWRGDRGDGGLDALYFQSEVPLNSQPAMEGLLAALRGRHALCRHVVVLHLWPLSHGDVLDRPSAPVMGDPPTQTLN